MTDHVSPDNQSRYSLDVIEMLLALYNSLVVDATEMNATQILPVTKLSVFSM